MTRILIVDDDIAFCDALHTSFLKRGYAVTMAHNVDAAVECTKTSDVQWALVDLNMPGASGLELIPKLLALNPHTRIVVLTGYATITTAVEAIKLGAHHYLSKPVTTEEIIAAFHRQAGDPKTPVATETLSLDHAEREHILTVFERNHRNVSAAARELNVHRRTLQRKLSKLKIR